MALAITLILLAGTGISTYFGMESRQQAQIAGVNAEQYRQEKMRVDQKADELQVERDKLLKQTEIAEAAKSEEKKQRRQAEAKALEAETEQQRAEANLCVTRIALAYQKWLTNDPDLAEDYLDACPLNLRKWEWNYLKGLCGLRLLRVRGHSCQISTIVFSPNGERIASLGSDGVVKLWDAWTGQELHSLDSLPGNHVCLAFTPDGGEIVTAIDRGQDSQINWWDVRSGRSLKTRAGPPDPLAFTPGLKRLICSKRAPCPSCAAAPAPTAKKASSGANARAGRNQPACLGYRGRQSLARAGWT